MNPGTTCRLHPRLSVYWAAAVLLVLSGCDVIADNPSIALSHSATFRFEFSSDGRSAGEPFEVRSTSSVNLADDLLADGFTKGEVLSASVTSVEISRTQPIGVHLSTLGDVSLGLTATGVARTTIARSASLPDSDDGQLAVQNASITAFVTAPSFSGVLTIDPASLRANSNYVLTTTVRLRVEVEGV